MSEAHYPEMLPHTMEAALRQRIADSKWEVPEETIRGWLDRMEKHMAHFSSPGAVQFQVDEIVHYLRLEQLLRNEIPNQIKYDHVVDMYMTAGGKAVTKHPIQPPEVTYGEVLHSAKCPKCHGTNTTSMAVQKRSPDEPTSYVHECLATACKNKWMDR